MPKTILITGCSSGIGLCTAETLHQKGYRVFATARNATDVEKLTAKGLESVLLDVNNSQSIREGLDHILEKTGGTLDALFNNSGFVLAGAVEDLSRDMMRSQFETNVFGPIELTNLVLPIMRKQGHGRIIQNGSILGIITMPYRGAYSASKFALEAFSNTLRQELRGEPIFVSIVEPGPIKSHLRNNAFTHYQKTLHQKSSAYRDVYEKMEKYFFVTPETERAFTLTPDRVAKKVLNILESTKPKAHYYIGFPAHLFAFLHRVLPDSAMDWVIERVKRGEARP